MSPLAGAQPARRDRASDDAEILAQFETAMQARGIIPPKHLVADGKLHRCDTEGRAGSGDGAYLLHLDGIAAGGFQNWRDGFGWETWRADIGARSLTSEERDDLRRKAAADRAEREAEEARRRAEAARKAAEIWFAADDPCDGHPYLSAKAVQPYGVRVERGDLVVPMRDAAGMLHNVQRIKPDGVKRYLYGGRVTGCYFAMGNLGDVILIGEGFSTCASAHAATGLAVAVAFDCGNLRPVAEALRTKFPEARIVIIADDDYRTLGNPGISKANEAAAAVGGVVAVPDFGPARPEGATDFNDLAHHRGAEAVRGCIEAALSGEGPAQETELSGGAAMPRDGAERVRVGVDAEEATPPGIREFPVMAEEAFIGLPGDIVRAVAPHTESDPVGLLLSAHAMFGNCIGRGPHYRVEATEHGTNLFVVKVGDSSKARKGTGEDRVLSFFRHVDDEWANYRVHTGLSSGEGVIWEVRDEITKKVRDKKSGGMVEELLDAGVSDKRLMIIESEFAGALRVMQREGNILSRILRDGWDRGNLATLTKNAPARATGSCISVVGHITATELRTYFDRTEMANGFGNRFLFACVRRSKLLPFGGALDDADVIGLAYEIRRAVQGARGIRQVTMAPEAAEAWIAIYPDLSADRPGLLGSLTARAEAHVVRLATLYALWAGSNRIELVHLMAAVAIEQFCRDSVEYIFADMLGDQVADTILDALRAAGTDGLTRTEISNLFARNASAAQIGRALTELNRRGLVARRKADAVVGRPAEIWVAA